MKRHVRIFISLISACLLLAACNALDEGYPDLLPTDQILAEPELPDLPADPTPATDSARADGAALEARAENLRGPVIDEATRRRMTR